MSDTPKKKPAAKASPSQSLSPIDPIDMDAIRSALAAYEAVKLPDYSSILSTIKVPDYSSILSTIRVPDYSSLLSAINLADIKLPTIDPHLLTSYQTFGDELTTLRAKVGEQATALSHVTSGAKDKEAQIAQLELTLEELQAKERIGFLLSRVNSRAQRHLLASDKFRRTFLESTECEAFVLSVDIRRSTELMLKAKSPEAFAEFISTLCVDLMTIVTDHYGVFDKFTGDGVLAFFPGFYAGADAAYYAVAAADMCHASFQNHYRRYRRSFSSILTETGLGIGVDFGKVHLVTIGGGLTVVGAPVVYACRLSAAPPGVTLVNQPAFEVISDRFGPQCFISETTLDIKHEGGMLGYDVRLNSREYKPAIPTWCDEVAPTKDDGPSA